MPKVDILHMYIYDLFAKRFENEKKTMKKPMYSWYCDFDKACLIYEHWNLHQMFVDVIK